MKRAWIIPTAICVLLLAAWPFRWEKGPTQSDRMLKAVHMRDCWTGQAWIALYGVADGKVYSGEMVPVPSQANITKRKEQILASPEERRKKQELEKQLAECEQELKRVRERVESTVGLSSFDKEGNWHGFTDEQLMVINPQEFYPKYKAIKEKLLNQEKQAEQAAISDLRRLAWQRYNVATGVWAGLVAISAIMAAMLFKRRAKPEDQHDPSL